MEHDKLRNECLAVIMGYAGANGVVRAELQLWRSQHQLIVYHEVLNTYEEEIGDDMNLLRAQLNALVSREMRFIECPRAGSRFRLCNEWNVWSDRVLTRLDNRVSSDTHKALQRCLDDMSGYRFKLAGRLADNDQALHDGLVEAAKSLFLSGDLDRAVIFVAGGLSTFEDTLNWLKVAPHPSLPPRYD